MPAPLLRAQRPCPAPAPLVTIQFCIAIQFGLLQPFQPQYSPVYCDTLSQPSLLACNTILQYTSLQPAFSCNTINCIAIQFSSSQAAQVIIQMLCCNTIFQHSLLLLAIQFQYCNTIFFFTILLGSSPKTILPKIFFSLLLLFYFSFISTGDTKIYIHFFFLQYIQ